MIRSRLLIEHWFVLIGDLYLHYLMLLEPLVEFFLGVEIRTARIDHEGLVIFHL